MGSAADHISDPILKKKILEQERSREKPIRESTIYLWNLYQLKKIGYPFGKDELDLNTWLDFGVVENVINEVNNEQIKNR